MNATANAHQSAARSCTYKIVVTGTAGTTHVDVDYGWSWDSGYTSKSKSNVAVPYTVASSTHTCGYGYNVSATVSKHDTSTPGHTYVSVYVNGSRVSSAWTHGGGSLIQADFSTD